VSRNTGSGLHAASYSNVCSANSPISEPMCWPSLMLISTSRASSQHCLAMSSLRPSGAWSRASPRSKSKHVRPAPPSAWISPTKIPCINPRALSVEFSYVGARVLRSAVGDRFLGSNTASSIAMCANRSSRASSVTGNIRFIRTTLHSYARLLTTTLAAENGHHRICRIETREKPGQPGVDEEVRTAEVVSRVDDHVRVRCLKFGKGRPDTDARLGLQTGRVDLAGERRAVRVREEVASARCERALVREEQHEVVPRHLTQLRSRAGAHRQRIDPTGVDGRLADDGRDVGNGAVRVDSE